MCPTCHKEARTNMPWESDMDAQARLRSRSLARMPVLLDADSQSTIRSLGIRASSLRMVLVKTLSPWQDARFRI